MTARSKRSRRLRALGLFLIGAYCAFFSLVVFSVGRESEPYSGDGSREVDGHARDVTCSRNWLVLGATWSCEATVVTPDGGRHRFSSFANSLSPADEGAEMTANRTRSGKKATTFHRTNGPTVNTLGMVVGGFGGIGLAIIGPIVVLARKREDATSPG